jgi:acetyl esterase/lipase
MRRIFLGMALLIPFFVSAQAKKPLDHNVYDSWQTIGEKLISNNGKWVLYTVDPQEGDGELVIQSTGNLQKKVFPRGYEGSITEDSRFAIFKIRPYYAETRQAKIHKKKPEDYPKDSLAILELGQDSVIKIARVKSYQVPEKGFGLLAYLMEKSPADTTRKFEKMDSTMRSLDSANRVLSQPLIEKSKKKKARRGINDLAEDTGFPISQDEANDAFEDPAPNPRSEEGTELVIANLATGEKKSFNFVSEYLWSKYGNILVMGATPNKKDSLSKRTVAVWRTAESRVDTILRGGNDFRNYAIDEKGYQLAFLAERDSSAKALQKFYKLWLWKNGQDSASMILDKNKVGMLIGWTVSENEKLSFSKSGLRLFMGTAPIQPPKDTSLADIDIVKLDIWNYKDDDLQTMQLKNLDRELKRSYTAMMDLDQNIFVQLGDKSIPQVITTKEGDGPQFIGISDAGKRIPLQWEGETLKDIYSINPADGSRKLVKKDLSGQVSASPTGNYILWYDAKSRQYFDWNEGVTRKISAKVRTKLYNEEFDMPDDPNPYGLMRWTENDASVLVYDRYDIWQLDPKAIDAPRNLTAGLGRKSGTIFRYLPLDPEEKFLVPGQSLLLRTFKESTKNMGIVTLSLAYKASPNNMLDGAYTIRSIGKAKNAALYYYTRESYTNSPDLFVNNEWKAEARLSHINPQQAEYSWGHAELFKWKTYSGKIATGIVYKPEDFDSKRKYPAICYFYEKLSDGLNQYISPLPTPSRLNISFFVSRGYIVFVPDIRYTIGHPGKSAYDFVVSGARAMVRKGWVDSTRIGLQGQSWGGYEVAYIITQTNLFKAAWAGAPVANMTSAYGGIRWETGMNRQFQYEHTQSRIGATLWERPNLYIENSPLFHIPKVKTPLVIMSNDNDGAVPWYQGIELFTAMRRLGKPVWLLNYNGEAHNLMERKNRKDIQIREQQFFDWLLKKERVAQWLKDGVPATMKGKNWGFELER